MRIFILVFLFVVIGLAAVETSAQSNDAKEELLAMSVDLTEGDLCGNVEDVKSQTISGSVIRRDFGADKLTLEGIVLKNGKDLRTFVNIDYEFLKGETGKLSEQLSELLMEGKKVSIKADRCGRVLVTRRLLTSK